MNLSKPDIEELYKKYGGMVYRRCHRLLDNETQAMDALQDVFTQLLKHQGRIEPNGMSSLLYRMATNTCLNMIRHQKVKDDYQAQSQAVEESCPSSDLATRYENLDALNRVMAKAPQKSREAAVYHYVDGFTMDEIAEMMQMSNSNVRRLIRELKQLSAQWEISA